MCYARHLLHAHTDDGRDGGGGSDHQQHGSMLHARFLFAATLQATSHAGMCHGLL